MDKSKQINLSLTVSKLSSNDIQLFLSENSGKAILLKHAHFSKTGNYRKFLGANDSLQSGGEHNGLRARWFASEQSNLAAGVGGEEAGRLMHVAPPPKANLTGALIRPCKISRHSDQRDSLQRVPPPPPPLLSSRRAKMTRNPLSA